MPIAEPVIRIPVSSIQPNFKIGTAK